MTKSPTWLSEFRSDTYSQAGEDGVIWKALDLLPSTDGWCVEFGAWNGRHLSNTRNLIETRNYSAVLIEAQRARYKKLADIYHGNPKVFTLNMTVGFEPGNTLDDILEGVPIPADFDVLSIDIDGNDYHTWRAVQHHRPKLVCIEFNPTIPTEVEFVQPADLEVAQGSSLLSLVELGKSKGYELVSVLPFNALFVDGDLFPLFEISDNRPQVLRTNTEHVTFLFSGYDGSIVLKGGARLPWHRIPIKENRVQQIPRFLRKYPNHYNAAQRILLQAYRVGKEPDRYVHKVLTKIKNILLPNV